MVAPMACVDVIDALRLSRCALNGNMGQKLVKEGKLGCPWTEARSDCYYRQVLSSRGSAATTASTGAPGTHLAPIPAVLALVLVASRTEPERLGEVVLVPPGNPGPVSVLGRDGAHVGENEHVLQLAQPRPGALLPTGALRAAHVSRRQWVVRSRGDDACEIINVGRRKLLVDGVERQRAVASPGTLVEMEREALFLLETRPGWMDGLDAAIGFAFGARDDDGIVGETLAAWEMRRAIRCLARQPGHVLICGETGSGKELVARAIHRHSDRAGGPFVARNASTIPEDIADAELFGNIPGYPHGGLPARPGLVGTAAGGSLLIDEFGDLHPSVQARLLRLLDSGEYQRLGEATPRRADIRVIGATNRPLDSLRADLLARFTQVLRVPPFRERLADVPLVARAMARCESRLEIWAPAALGELLRSECPANARTIASWIVRGGEPQPDIGTGPVGAASRSEASGACPEAPGACPEAPGAAPAHGEEQGASHEARQIQEILDLHNGSLEKTWRALGLSSRHALARLVKKYGLVVRRQL
jgi:transcriptional regulator with AAA-type ATPase domain